MFFKITKKSLIFRGFEDNLDFAEPLPTPVSGRENMSDFDFVSIPNRTFWYYDVSCREGSGGGGKGEAVSKIN